MRRLKWSPPRRRGEDGVFLVLYALMFVAIFTMVAIVLDLSAVRSGRRTARSVADAAATAGAMDLGLGRQAACRTSFTYAARNLGFASPTPDPCAGILPMPDCATTDTTQATFGDYTVFFRSSVPSGDQLMKADTPGGDINQTLTPNDGAECDRVGVEIRYDRDTIFSRVAGILTNRTTVHSVALKGAGRSDDSAALVLLERNDCRAARVQGSNTKILVAAIPASGTSPGTPGAIQSDSRGDGSCPGGARILEGGPGQAIKAEHARNASGTIVSQARIGIYGKLFGATNAHTPWPAEIGEPDPIGAEQVGRTPVDERYLANERALETDATLLVNMTTPPFGYLNVTGSPGLNLGCTIDTPTPITTAMGSKLWFYCPSGLTVKNLTITSANSEIVIASDLTVSAPGFTINDARKVWIKGKSTGNDRGLDVGAPFVVNNDGFATCAARFAADRTEIGTMFLKEGSMLMAGGGSRLQLCQMHVYLRGANSPGAASFLPTAVTPAPALPPGPATNASLGTINMSSGSVDWTAPNELDLLPTAADLAIYKFEDLALWTEASSTSPLNGGGGMNLGGIFFLPNANSFEISGNAGQTISVDAQFFVRKLDVTGGSTLRMVPNPANQVPVKISGVRLIR